MRAKLRGCREPGPPLCEATQAQWRVLARGGAAPGGEVFAAVEPIGALSSLE